MTTAQAQLELALSEYDGKRLSAIRLHNACPNNMPRLRDTLWQSVRTYEEFCGTLQTCLKACVNDTAFAVQKQATAQYGATDVAQGKTMHYRNGREAKNGDKVIQFEMDSAMPLCVGTLEGAQYGEDFCNGRIEVPNSEPQLACLCDCLHVDDVAEILRDRGLDHRPAK